MENHYKVIVIGAGPAGTACGITLQKSGINHCLIDKAVFPRNKTCAGLVTKKTYELIQSLLDYQDTDFLFCDTSSTIRLYRKTKLLADAPLKRNIRLVERHSFDNTLAERYKALGGKLFEGEAGITIDYPHNRIVLSSGQILYYETLIFADGALSMSHKLLDTDNKSKMAFGVETYVSSDVIDSKSIDIYFDYVDNGYLWVFPHGERVCVGVAGKYAKDTDYRENLKTFLTDIGVDTQDIKYIGAFLPYGYVIPQEKLPENVLLVGDAGGFTDPISGEGLYMALKTGTLSAQAISTADPKKSYLQMVKNIVSIVKEGNKVQKLFYSPKIHKIVLDKLEGKHQLVSFFFENQVEEYHYEYRHIFQMYRDYKKTKTKS